MAKRIHFESVLLVPHSANGGPSVRVRPDQTGKVFIPLTVRSVCCSFSKRSQKCTFQDS